MFNAFALAGMLMDSEKDRREHQRLPLKLSVLCQKVGLSAGDVYTGSSVDVSPGGMLIEFNNCTLKDGELLSVEMAIPPTQGLLEYGGRFSSYARVVRIDQTHVSRKSRSVSIAQRVALEFCESPKLRT